MHVHMNSSWQYVRTKKDEEKKAQKLSYNRLLRPKTRSKKHTVRVEGLTTEKFNNSLIFTCWWAESLMISGLRKHWIYVEIQNMYNNVFFRLTNFFKSLKR